MSDKLDDKALSSAMEAYSPQTQGQPDRDRLDRAITAYLAMSADTAPAAMPGDAELLRLVDAIQCGDQSPEYYAAAMRAAIDDAAKADWSKHGATEIALGQWKARAESAEAARDEWKRLFWEERRSQAALESRALAAEAALAAERANAVDGSIDIRLDEKGGIDEIFGNGVLCHIERMDKGHWFISMTRPDQTGEAFWMNGKGKVEFTLHEHRPAPKTGPNVEPWTIAAALRARGE